VHPAATGKDASARNVGAIEGSPPSPNSSHSFCSPPTLCLALARRTASQARGCSRGRPRSNMRRAVAPVGCSREMRGATAESPCEIQGGTEARWPRDITRELQECDVSPISDNRRGRVGEGERQEREGGEGKGNWRACVRACVCVCVRTRRCQAKKRAREDGG